MKFRRGLCSTILFIITLCLLLSLPVFAQDSTVGLSNFRRNQVYTDGMFSDVPKNAWYYRNVAEAYEYGLMIGTDKGFEPAGNISVIETVVTACRLHNIYNGGTHVFETMQPWYQPYVRYASTNDIFRPWEYSDYSVKATRAQFASILANALPKEALPLINSIDNGAIPDVPMSADYADAVYLLYRAGIIIGDETNAFRADRQISRAEVAAILTRMANPDLRLSVTLPEKSTYPLTYTVNADGTSCTVTGCDPSVYAVNIPAKLNGLTVTAIDGAAFTDCNQLTEFTADADHPVFYTEDGVLFTDIPEKTLVRFPPAYHRTTAYIVPDGTKHIAAYAFAGIVRYNRTELISISIADGVVSIGDYAFAHYQEMQMFIYVPDSLTQIGQHLTQFSKGNIPFYVSSRDTAFAQYANQNQLPCGVIRPNEPTDIPLPVSKTPECLPADQMTAPTGEIITVEVEDITLFNYYKLLVNYFYDFSEQQQDFDGEIRLMLGNRWKDAIPDAQGHVNTPYFTQTGVWGAGKTDEEAILRGYDLDGNLVCMQYISGDFTFAFPGAYHIGVEGGTNTRLTALPIEPIYIDDACDYPVIPEQWDKLPDGNIMKLFVISKPFSTFTHQNTDDRIWLGYMQLDAANKEQSFDLNPNYQIVLFRTYNPPYVDKLENSYIRIDYSQTAYEDLDISILKKSSITIPENYAENVNAAWDTVKACMNDTYIAKISDDYRLYFLINDKYPTASRNMINVDQPVYSSFENGKKTIYHEMVHAVDFSMEIHQNNLTPSPWLEGRAEYICEKIMQQIDPDYHDYEDTYDWSFISAEERADFFRYYYFSTNRYTDYSVGYYFCKYLCETYGETIMVKITDELGKLDADKYYESDEEKAMLFKSCITSVTDENVFQNFVRDVIEQ